MLWHNFNVALVADDALAAEIGDKEVAAVDDDERSPAVARMGPRARVHQSYGNNEAAEDHAKD